MTWRKLGLVWAPPGGKAWARTHAFLPTPHQSLMATADSVRIACGVGRTEAGCVRLSRAMFLNGSFF